MKRSNFLWYCKMALRDARKNLYRLAFFGASIVLGIAALVGIRSFGDALNNQIDSEAKELLGADLVIKGMRPLDDSLQQKVASTEKAMEANFASMVYYPAKEGLRLAQVRALEGNYPFYGEIETTPAAAFSRLKKDKIVLLEQRLLIQLDAAIGDSLQIGAEKFQIAGTLGMVPGQTGIAATVAPVVYIPYRYLDLTGLSSRGSRINYRYYYRLPADVNVKVLTDRLAPSLAKDKFETETIEDAKERTTDAYSSLTKFLNLIAFISLLLGCLGVAGAVHYYIREKIPYVATLRCLGATANEAVMIYLIQILIFGLAGGIAGSLLGLLVQLLLPMALSQFLIIKIPFTLSATALLTGIATGTVAGVLFSLLPLVPLRKVSPLLAIRYSTDEARLKDPLRFLIYFLILVFIYLFAFLQTGKWRDAAIFTVALFIAFTILAGLGYLIMIAARKFFPAGSPYPLRQGTANLFRPGNQTSALTASLGLGALIISALYIIQSALLHQVSFGSTNKDPNMLLFDIQEMQKEPLLKFTRENKLDIYDLSPVVTIRLEKIKGKDKKELEQKEENKLPEWVFNREYRVTYRNTITPTEKLLQGHMAGRVKSPQDSIFISLDEGFAKTTGVKLGDELTFNVQGTQMNTYVGSRRKVDWKKIQSNFTIVFPEGVLESAPKFYILTTRTSSVEASSKFQISLVKLFPNVSVVDLTFIVRTVSSVLEQIAAVIRFMTFFSIATGLLVLAGSVLNTKYQRIQENILLRTLGANKKTIFLITIIEYFILGSIASLSGIALGILAGWSFSRFVMETDLVFDMLPVALIYIALTAVTVLIGIFNNRKVMQHSPLEILRRES